jgi:hypothetical protein
VVSNKHQLTYQAIFSKPTKASIVWKDIEAMLVNLGADITEGNGSRVRIHLKGIRAVFHRPHPKKETNKRAVISMRRFLQAAKITNIRQ